MLALNEREQNQKGELSEMRKNSMKKVSRKITTFALTVTVSAQMLLLPGTTNSIFAQAAEKETTTTEKTYDYGRAWQQTLMFYEFQKSGKLSGNDRNNWKGDSCVNDGQDVGLDLTGGWYDAGDHVKFNLPMSYSATTLAWSYLEFEDTYKKTGQDKYMLDEIKWVNDYFIKCHPSKDVYYYQVGNGDIDHQFWGAPELLELQQVIDRGFTRPSYKCGVDADNGGSAVCAGTAASLAAASIIFKDSNPEYSELCIKHAKELYDMALRAQNDNGYHEYAKGYYTSSHFEDELSWGGVWIYKATGEEDYLKTAESYSHKWGGEEMVGNLKGNVWTQCWDDVRYGAMLLIAELDQTEAGKEYRDGIEYNLDYWSTGVDDGNGAVSRGKYTPKGLVMINDWGSLRYAASEAFMATLYCQWKDADPVRVKNYMQFAKSQADYILGSTGRSYIVGYDETSPKNPHHRTAHGAWKNSPLGYPDTSRHTLVGALVGGPLPDDSYEDDRNNYCTNEVADDYNAGAVGLMGAMYASYGGTIDPDMTAVEPVGQEYYMDGCNYQKGEDDKGNSYCEVKLTVENHTAWPARGVDQLSFKYFVNIKDLLDEGFTADDFKVICYYSQRKAVISQLIPWNKDAGIYYVEVTFGGDSALKKAYDEKGITYVENGEADSFIYPAGDVECRADMQLRIEAPGKMDFSKSPTYSDIANTEVDEKAEITHAAIYEKGKLVGGEEPAKSGEVIVEPPTTTQQPTTTEKITTTAATEEETKETTVAETTQKSTNVAPTTVTETTVAETTTESTTTEKVTQPTTTEKVTQPTTTEKVTQPTTTEKVTQPTTTEKITKPETTENTETTNAKAVGLNESTVFVCVGKTAQLSYETNQEKNTVKWESLNPEIVSVDQNGVVTGVKEGSTKIILTLNGVEYTALAYAIADKITNPSTTAVETTKSTATTVAETTKAVEPTTVAETTKEVEPTTVAETTKEVEPTTVAETTKAIESTTVAETTKPAATTVAETTKEVESTTVAETTKAIESTTVAETTKEVESTTVAETTKAVEPTTVAETTKAVEATTETPTTNTNTTNTNGNQTGQAENKSKFMVGTIIRYNGLKYKITKNTASKREVEVVGAATKNLKKVKIPSQIRESRSKTVFKVTSVGSKAFAKNQKITLVSIGTNVNEIGKQAFYNCKNIKRITIAKNVKKIGKMAFYGCKNLSAVSIKSKKLKSAAVQARAFGGNNKKIVYRVPKGKQITYKKLLVKKGAGTESIVRN